MTDHEQLLADFHAAAKAKREADHARIVELICKRAEADPELADLLSLMYVGLRDAIARASGLFGGLGL